MKMFSKTVLRGAVLTILIISLCNVLGRPGNDDLADIFSLSSRTNVNRTVPADSLCPKAMCVGGQCKKTCYGRGGSKKTCFTTKGVKLDNQYVDCTTDSDCNGCLECGSRCSPH